ncbi:hypothetical protein HID58_002162 [Brassica napus]|uniref:Uncharacterized protein n=1 Tax=Brassica napus TaxID=3708 RepID=A0ABQ8ELQ5_BRANA|nr:hypothetical protein HID58_002162 [Brassica napus]
MIILRSPTNSLIHGRFNPQSTAHFFGVYNSPGGSQGSEPDKLRSICAKKAANSIPQGMFLMEYFFVTI